MTLQNPLATAYTLTGLQAKVSFPKDTGAIQVGHVDSIPEPCTVPAGQSVTCAQWNVALDASIGDLLGIITAKDKSMDMTQTISCTVGGPDGYPGKDFDIILFYFKRNKTLTFCFLCIYIYSILRIYSIEGGH